MNKAIVMNTQSQNRKRPLWHSAWLSTAALGAALAANAFAVSVASAQAGPPPPPPPPPTAFKGTFNAVGGSAALTSTTATATGLQDRIDLKNTTAVINWTPTDTAAGLTAIDFLGAGDSAVFAGAPNFTVLNRIIPVGSAAARRIAINGQVAGRVNPVGAPAVVGGNIWFYTPNGFLIGSTASFNMSGLTLSTLDHPYNATSGALIFNGAGGSDWGGAATLAASSIEVASGATFTLNITNSYLALISPRVVQGGSAVVNGSVAYIAAEAVSLRLNAGLFDIDITQGSSDTNGIVHTGSTTGAGSPGGIDQRAIAMVAIPKNNAMTMLVGGTVGYQPASIATVENGSVILSAGYDRALLPNNTASNVREGNASAGITLTGGTFTSSVDAKASGDALINLTGTTISLPGYTVGASDKVVHNLKLASDSEVAVTIGIGASLAVSGALSLDGSRQNPAIAAAVGRDTGLSIVGGGTVSLGSLTMDSSVSGSASPSADRSSRGGVTSLAVVGAGSALTVTGDTTLSATGTGGTGANGGQGTVGGIGQGGGVVIDLSGGAVGNFGRLFVDANASGGTGGNGSEDAGGGGGQAIAGSVSLTVSGAGTNLNAAFAQLSAIAQGGKAGDTASSNNVIAPNAGNAVGGNLALSANSGGAITMTNQAIVSASSFGGDAGGLFTDYANKTGGNGGLSNGGSITIGSATATGSIRIGSLSVDARAFGGLGGGAFDGNGTGLGTGGNGGAANSGVATIFYDIPINAGNLFATMDATGGAGGAGVTGGNGGSAGGSGGATAITLRSTAASSLGTVSLISSATGGAGGVGTSGTSGFGGNAAGADATLTLSTADLVIGTLLVDGSGTGGTGLNGGSGRGGNTALTLLSGDVSATQFNVGSGGFGGNATDGAPIAGTGGSGSGGLARLFVSNTARIGLIPIIATAVTPGRMNVTSGGGGGKGGSPASGTTGQGGTGGVGKGGTVSVEVSNAFAGGAGNPGDIDISVIARGGDGGNTADDRTAGIGGASIGGTVDLKITGGVPDLNLVSVSSASFGGAGGASLGIDASGGAGGNATGGRSTVLLATDPTWAALSISAVTTGGAGGTGIIGGAGGNAISTQTSGFTLTTGALTVGSISIDTRSTGGIGADGTVRGGDGGNAQSGAISLGAVGAGSDMLVTSTLDLTATAQSGSAGATLAVEGSGITAASSGTAIGGAITAFTDAGGTIQVNGGTTLTSSGRSAFGASGPGGVTQDSGGNSGNATSGAILFAPRLTGGLITNQGALTANATSRTGDAGSGGVAVLPSDTISFGGNAGTATSGDISVSITGVTGTDAIINLVSAAGGGLGGGGGTGGNGGLSRAGNATLNLVGSNNGNIITINTTAGSLVDGLAINSGGFGSAGAGGAGGASISGNALLNVQENTSGAGVTFSSLTIDASALGGTGASGRPAGVGGAATSGQAALTVTGNGIAATPASVIIANATTINADARGGFGGVGIDGQSPLALRNGGNGANGGAASAGAARITISGVDAAVTINTLSFGANGIGGQGGRGGNGFNDSGGGVGGNGGAGGVANAGGIAAIAVTGGSLSVTSGPVPDGPVNLTADSQGGVGGAAGQGGDGQGPGRPGGSGSATGGTALLAVTGGTVILPSFTVSARGLGGSTEFGSIGNGGDGIGGTARLTLSDIATLNAPDFVIVSDGRGGNSGRSITAAGDGASGGNGSGGTSEFLIAGVSNSLTTAKVTLSSSGTGGRGGNGTTGAGGVGGNGGGGTVSSNFGNLTAISGLAADTSGFGGNGGNGISGGTGGVGSGGVVAFNSTIGGSLTISQTQINISGQGGTGGAGGIGGLGQGGALSFLASGGSTLTIDAGQGLFASGTGGNGGLAGAGGDGSAGGDGRGGTISFTSTTGGTINTGNLLRADASGFGGVGSGGAVGLNGASAQGTVAASGGVGGNATSLGGTGLPGGNGTDGLNGDNGGNGGQGGAGGLGRGGTISFSAQTSGAIASGELNLTTAGFGGQGGIGGDGGIGGSGQTGGDGGVGGVGGPGANFGSGSILAGRGGAGGNAGRGGRGGDGGNGGNGGGAGAGFGGSIEFVANDASIVTGGITAAASGTGGLAGLGGIATEAGIGGASGGAGLGGAGGSFISSGPSGPNGAPGTRPSSLGDGFTGRSGIQGLVQSGSGGTMVLRTETSNNETGGAITTGAIGATASGLASGGLSVSGNAGDIRIENFNGFEGAPTITVASLSAAAQGSTLTGVGGITLDAGSIPLLFNGPVLLNTSENITIQARNGGQIISTGAFTANASGFVLIDHFNATTGLDLVKAPSISISGAQGILSQFSSVLRSDTTLSLRSLFGSVTVDQLFSVDSIAVDAGANVTLNTATVNGLVTPGFFSPPTGGSITLRAGLDPFGSSASSFIGSATINGAVTATGSIDVSANDQIILSPAARLRSNNNIRLASGGDIQIASGAELTSALNVASALTQSSIDISAGSIARSFDNGNDPASIVIGAASLTAAGSSINLTAGGGNFNRAGAIDAQAATFTTPQFSADILSANGQGTSLDDAGLLSANCFGGSICLGRVNATGIRIGNTGTPINLSIQVGPSGVIAENIAITAQNDIRFTAPNFQNSTIRATRNFALNAGNAIILDAGLIEGAGPQNGGTERFGTMTLSGGMQNFVIRANALTSLLTTQDGRQDRGSALSIEAGSNGARSIGTIDAEGDLGLNVTNISLGRVSVAGRLGSNNSDGLFLPDLPLTFGSVSLDQLTISGGAVQLNAGLVEIGELRAFEGSDLIINAGTIFLGSAQGVDGALGNVDLTATGNVRANSVAAGGTVSLTASTGSVTAGNISGGQGITITAGQDLIAGNVGARAGNISLTSGGLITTGDINAAAGSATITNAGGPITTGLITVANDFTLTTGSRLNLGGVMAGDDVRITTTSDATFGTLGAMGIGTDNDGNGSNIVLSVGGALFVDHAEAKGDFTATATRFATGPNTIITGGDIDLDMAGPILLGNSQAGGFIKAVSGTDIDFGTMTSGGALTLTATGQVTGVSGTAVGAVAITGTSGVSIGALSGGGNVVTLAQGGNLQLGTVTSGRIFAGANFGPGDISIDSVTAQADVIVLGKNNITIGTAIARGTVPILTAGSGTLLAAVGTTGTSILTGDVFVSGGNTVSVASAQARRLMGIRGNSVTSTGQLTAGEDIRITSSTSAAINQITAGDDILVEGTGLITIQNGSTTGTGTGALDIALVPVGGFDGFLDFFNAVPAVPATAGSDFNVVATSATGRVSVGTVSANDDLFISSSNDISYTAASAGDALTALAVSATAASATITGGTATAGGALFMVSNDAFSSGSLTSTGGTIAAGSLTDTATFAGPVVAAGTVSLGGTTIAAQNVSGGQLVRLDATQSITAGNIISTADNVQITSATGMTTGPLTATTGSVVLTNPVGTIATGLITSADPFILNTPSSLALGGVTSTNGSITIVTPAAASLGTLNATAAGASISANAASLTTGNATASGGITFTSASTLNAGNIVSNAGDIGITTVGAITTGDLSALLGSVSIANSLGLITTGLITVGNDFTLTTGSDLIFAGVSVGDDIRITTTGGAQLGDLRSLGIGTDNEGDGSNIVLNVTSALTLNSANAAGSLTANGGSVDVGTSTAGSALTFVATSGALNFGQLASGTNMALTANTGAISGNGANSGGTFAATGQSLTLPALTAATNATLTATGAIALGQTTVGSGFRATGSAADLGRVTAGLIDAQTLQNLSFTQLQSGSGATLTAGALLTGGSAISTTDMTLTAGQTIALQNARSGRNLLINGGAGLTASALSAANDLTANLAGPVNIVSAVAGGTAGQSSIFVVNAINNTSNGGLPVDTLLLTAGQQFSISSSTDDLWSAGSLPRFADGNGLIITRLATAGDDSGQAVGTLIGDVFGSFTQGNLTAPFASLAGLIAGNYQALGANGTFTAAQTGTLGLVFWDQFSGDNFGNITFTVSVPGVITPGVGNLAIRSSAGLISYGSIAAGNAVTLATPSSLSGGAITATGGNLNLTAQSADVASLTAGGNIFGTTTGAVTIGTASAIASLGIAGSSVVGTGAWSAGGDILVQTQGTAILGAVSAGDDLTINALGGITIVNGAARGTGGNADELVLRNSPTLQFAVLDGDRAGSNIVLSAQNGAITAATLAAASNISASASISSNGAVLVSTDLQAGGTVTATGTSVDLTSLGSVTFGNLTATNGNLSVALGGTFGLEGVATGNAIAIRSADLVINPSTARIGTAGTTGTVTLTNTGTRQTFIGGTGGSLTGNYGLSNAEVQRIFANNIAIFAPVIGGPASTSFNSARAPDVIIDALNIVGGTNINASGRFSVTTEGKVRVIGAAAFTGLTDGNTIAIRGDEAVEILDAGSVTLNGTGGLAGTLDLTSRNIVASSSAALADFATALDLKAISDRAGRNDGAVNDGGYLQAGGIRATLLNSTLIIQNTGGNSISPVNKFDQRRGFTVGAGGFAVIQGGSNPVRVAVNGRFVNPVGGFITGLKALPLVGFTGLFDPLSTINGCAILNPASCSVSFDQIGITRDTINRNTVTKSGGGGGVLPLALIQLKDVEALGYQPIIDDPVTGAGNDDLWAIDDDRDKEETAPAPQ